MNTEAGVADEFSTLREASDDAGIEWRGPPAVARREIAVADGRVISALVWGDDPSLMVLLHGGAQNAHTWDTVALAVRGRLAAIDLPGHGHSSWRPDADYSPSTMASDVVVAVAALAAARGCVLVGMGLGAPVAIRIAVDRPDLVRRLVFVDSASGVPLDERDRHRSEAGEQVAEFTSRATFASFDELLARTVQYNPRRSEASLRRGAVHNSKQLADGTWTWRWDPAIKGGRIIDDPGRVDLTRDPLAAPVLVVRGELSDAVTDEAAATLASLHPDTRLVTLTGAGHGVQGDRPRELAYLLRAETEIAIGEED
jgi:pimeloyl-ACP methyl ester carboxylesterase